MESPKGTTQGPARARVTATEKRRHRDAEAARLRASGLSYDDIADKLKFGIALVHARQHSERWPGWCTAPWTRPGS